MAPPPTLPPNPSLVAIALIVQSDAGSRFVFHYPPHPRADTSNSLYRRRNNLGWKGAAAPDNPDSSAWTDTGESGESDEDDFEGTTGAPGGASRSRTAGGGVGETGDTRSKSRRLARHERDHEAWSSDDDIAVRKGKAWEYLFGYPTEGLQKLLSPGRSLGKSRFELAMDGLLFLGYPVHVRDDGLWRKKKRRRDGSLNADDLNGGPVGNDQGEAVLDGDQQNDKEEEGAKRPRTEKNQSFSDYDDGDWDERSSQHESKMDMFHVVFVLNPPIFEHRIRVQEMYDNVVKKFSRALRYEQARSNYVWEQADMMISMRDRAKEESESTWSLTRQTITLTTKTCR
jgi:nitrogen permease regulator 3-like protein